MTEQIDPRKSALILIDLQQAIVARDTAPHSAASVVANGARLAAGFRAAGGTVVYVRVDLADMLKLKADKSMRDPNAPPLPPEASEIVAEAGMEPGDLLVTKRQWGAFFGTGLEAQLRGRGIETVAVCGIATNFGVESTARAAAGLGFALIVAEDATTSLDAEMHRFACERIFPLLGRVRSTVQLLAMLAG